MNKRRKFLKNATMAGATLFANVTAFAQTKQNTKGDGLKMSTQNKEQKIVKFGEAGKIKGNAQNFIGDVNVSMYFLPQEYNSTSAALVEFSAGARTAWHTHPCGQNLIVTKGKILTSTKDGVAHIAEVGDSVLCPPNVKHFHGALPNESASHIAITGHDKDGSAVTWMELVKDDEYMKFCEKVKSETNQV